MIPVDRFMHMEQLPSREHQDQAILTPLVLLINSIIGESIGNVTQTHRQENANLEVSLPAKHCRYSQAATRQFAIHKKLYTNNAKKTYLYIACYLFDMELKAFFLFVQDISYYKCKRLAYCKHAARAI